MAFLTEKKFSFISKAPSLAEDTFAVVNFKGFEAISRPYEFDIMLVSDNPEIGLSEVLQNPARFAIHRENGAEVHYNGILAQFEQLHEYGGYVFYRALLVPKLWWLSLTHHNQVCLGNSVLEIIENTLKDGGLTSLDFAFKIQKEYPAIDYVCQYGESHFNFVSRWAEKEGIYYYFEQNEKGEKIIFTDTKISHTDLPQEKILYYSPPSGLDTLHRTETIKTLTCRQRHLPRKVYLKDYNYEKPSLGIEGTADVDPNGRGEVYLYGEYFPTPEEGNRLAAIRAEELLCRKIQFFGESTVPFIEPGYTFTLNDHYRSSFNQKYLITEVTHEGSQTGYLISGIRTGLEKMEENVYYLNNFTAIPADVHYRPERKAEKPRISGTIHAKIDAEGSGNHAELDEQGRYKVRLPFDINGDHRAGKASSFVSMMQPYAGSNYGVHFPLHKGTDVHLSFVNGDPDRPVICGAVPNPETVSPVTSANQTNSIFRDDYGNELIFNATPGNEHVRLHSPHHNSTLALGRSFEASCANDCVKYTGANSLEAGLGTKIEGYGGSAVEVKGGLALGAFFGLSAEAQVAGKFGFLLGPEMGIHIGPKWEYHVGPSYEKSENDSTSIADKHNIIAAGKTINLVGGVASGDNGKVSILEGNENRLSISFGKNKNPTTKAGPKIIAMVILGGLGILSAVIALILSIVSFICLIIQEVKGDEKSQVVQGQDVQDQIDTSVRLHKGIWDAVGGTFSILVVVAAVFAAIFIMVAGWMGSSEKHEPKSHTDDAGDDPDAYIELQKEGVFIGIKPKVIVKTPGTPAKPAVSARPAVPATATTPAIPAVPAQPAVPAVPAVLEFDKDEKPLAKIEMDKNGKVSVHSKATKDDDKQILLGIGKSGSESAKTTLKNKEILLEVGDSKLTLKEDQVEVKSGSAKITIKKDGEITIDSDRAIKLLKNKLEIAGNKVRVKTLYMEHKCLHVGG